MRRTSIAVLALALTACGGPAAPAEEEFSLPTAAAYFTTPCPEAGTKPATDKELTYWSMWTKDEPQGKVLRYAADCFTKKTGVKVTIQWLGRAYLRQNLLPALNTDTVPDLFDQDLTNIKAAIASAGGTRPLDDVLNLKTGDGVVRDVLPAAYRDSAAIKDESGKPFAVPYLVMGNAWWYDKKKVPGLKPPATMKDLYTLFGDRSVALDGDIGYYAAWFFDQLATRYVGPGGLARAAQDPTGRLWKSDPGFLKAAEHTAGIAAHLVDGWDAGKFPQIQQRWADGDATYLFMGSWGPTETREYLTKQGGGQNIDYGSFQFPMPDGATHDVIEVQQVAFGVTAKARHPEAAKAFIAYFLTRDLLAGLPAVADSLTPRTDLPVPSDLTDLKAALENPAKKHTLFMDGLDGVADGKFAEQVFFPADNDLLKGRLTPVAFVDRLVTATAAFWKAQG
ncbi:sugar ABC transporter substrate-binding protein [Nonomuraea sp. WAC 01424]|uniref:ABC transporter substrate-binding protein n=1 Tax=Nonomuraea sp. WAC 01424 TaxID=2203200 RepID=UPI000F79CDA6|nr:ABC transporter substrate-binding protein [Nonomuraea sp. WAC 01424]RSN11600.1 sugar ABC transporter substrate-binding protein [Nonomuraea sp. WAC 01424]